MHWGEGEKGEGMGNRASGVRLKLRDLFHAREVSHDLMARLRGDLYISDWTRSHANYFRAVQIEKTMMFIILLLIVAVAAVNNRPTPALGGGRKHPPTPPLP